ncbi:MAG: bifunctional 5,10-methylenetetrahydrofolate dehydrogenase/5,10-methenyltetrahydrofolate cyclohydrolase, partial [Oscillospiraceae bacterium]
PDDMFYESSVLKKFAKYSLEARTLTLPKDISEMELVGEIQKLNADSTTHGVLMMRPLPKHIDEKKICSLLNPEKDSDGITEYSMSKIYSGEKDVFAPCTAEACIEMLKFYNIDIKGKNVAVLGRSLVIGKPVAMLLVSESATVTICHSKTADIKSLCQNADIIISAIGKAKFVTAEFVKPHQTIIDVGINYDEAGNLVGDVDFDNVEPIVKAISPVPGGVGSITTSVLMRHVVNAALRTIK